MAIRMNIQFSVESKGADAPKDVTGKICYDPQGRSKIVFLLGYQQNWKSWRGVLPQDGEVWVVEEIKDTKPEEPRKGAILVRLVKKAVDEPGDWQIDHEKGLAAHHWAFGAKPMKDQYLMGTFSPNPPTGASAEVVYWWTTSVRDEAEEEAAESLKIKKISEKIAPRWDIAGETTEMIDGVNFVFETPHIISASMVPTDGATIEMTQRIFAKSASRGKILAKECETSQLIGWDGVTVHGSCWYYEAGTMQVEFIVRRVKGIKMRWPVTVDPPQIGKPREELLGVYQKANGLTPVGPVEGWLCLYHPRTNWSDFDQVVGDYDISALIAEANRQLLETHHIGSLPMVEWEIRDQRLVNKARISYNCDRELVADGVDYVRDYAELFIWCTPGFFAKGCAIFCENSLDPQFIAGEVKKEVDRVIDGMTIREAETLQIARKFGEQLLAHVMSQLPKFEKPQNVWVVDLVNFTHQPYWNWGEKEAAREKNAEILRRLAPCKTGQAIISYPEEIARGRGGTHSEVITIMSVEEARERDIPGRVFEGELWSYWPVGPDAE